MIGQCVYDRQARRVKALIPLGPAGICVIVQGSAKTLYIYTVYDRIFGDFPAKNTVHTPYIYMALANPSDRARVGQNPHTVRRIRKRWGISKYGGLLYGVYIRSAKTRTRSDEYGNGGEISNTVAGYTAYFGIFVRFGQTLSMTGPVCSTHPCHAHCGLHTGLATCVCLHIVCDRMHEHLCDRMHERLCDRMQAHLCDRMQAHLCDRMHEHCPATC